MGITHLHFVFIIYIILIIFEVLATYRKTMAYDIPVLLLLLDDMSSFTNSVVSRPLKFETDK